MRPEAAKIIGNSQNRHRRQVNDLFIYFSVTKPMMNKNRRTQQNGTLAQI